MKNFWGYKYGTAICPHCGIEEALDARGRMGRHRRHVHQTPPALSYRTHCDGSGKKPNNRVSGPQPLDPLLGRLQDLIRRIADHTDADNPDSYRCDDREGFLDTVHDLCVNEIASWPNAHALAEERSDDSQQRVVGGKVDR